VRAFGDPGGKALTGMARRLGGGDAARVETQRARLDA
jgi:hypothetical protein